MFGKAAARRAGKLVIVVAVAAVAAMAVWAILDSSPSHPLYDSFKEKLFIGGVAIMAVGGVIGMGMSEMGLYGSKMFAISSDYMHAANDDRLERRRQQFAFMIYCAAIGALMMALPFVLP
jgi:hypothetical protein